MAAIPPVLGAVLRRDILVGKDGNLAHAHAEWLERLRKDALFYKHRTIRAKLGDIVSVADFDAYPDGSDVTSQIEEAAASGATALYFPGSTTGHYCMSDIAWPSTIHRLYGDGETASIIEAIGTITPGSPLWFFGGTDGLTVENLGLIVDPVLYPTVNCIVCNTTTDVLISNVATQGGLGGIQFHNCVDAVAYNCSSEDTVQFGMIGDGASSFEVYFQKCNHSGACTAHGISMGSGSSMHILDCFSEDTEGFGFNLLDTDHSSVIGCKSRNSLAEGVNIESCSFYTVGWCNVWWDGTESVELGMSIIGNSRICSFGKHIGNTISHNGKAGIGIDGSVTGVDQCEFIGNIIVTPGIIGNPAADFSSGIVLYGPGAVNNKICDNIIFDNLGNMVSGVAEQDVAGVPTGNQIYGNTITGQSGAKVLLLGPLSTTDVPLAFTATVTASTPTLTTATGTVRYHTIGTVCYFSATITITTNGTGAGSIICTLPYTPTGGVAHGRANGVSGKQLQAVFSGATMVIVNYDNTYPGADGEQLLVEGFFEITGL